MKMEFITKIDRKLAKIEEILLALFLVGMVVLAALQVLLRNIWNTSIDWADMSLQNVTVLVGLLGAAVATSEGRHLNIDLMSRILTGRWKFLLQVIIGIFAVIICVLLAIGGWETYRVNYIPWVENIPQGWSIGRALKDQVSQGDFPQWLSQIFLPFGFGLIGLHFFLRLICDIGTLVFGKEAEQEQGLEGEAFLDDMEAKARLGGGEK